MYTHTEHGDLDEWYGEFIEDSISLTQPQHGHPPTVEAVRRHTMASNGANGPSMDGLANGDKSSRPSDVQGAGESVKFGGRLKCWVGSLQTATNRAGHRMCKVQGMRQEQGSAWLVFFFSPKQFNSLTHLTPTTCALSFDHLCLLC